MAFTRWLGVALFPILILVSFVAPYIFIGEAPPYVLFIFWAIISLISIVLAHISLSLRG